MKWSTPKNGDKRERIIFALLPRDCMDGHTRWLERILIFEKYIEAYEWSDWVVYKAKGL